MMMMMVMMGRRNSFFRAHIQWQGRHCSVRFTQKRMGLGRDDGGGRGLLGGGEGGGGGGGGSGVRRCPQEPHAILVRKQA